MADRYDSYRVFLASPGDVAAERNVAADTISKIDMSCREILAISLELKRWETMPPATPVPIPVERLQAAINEEVKKAKFFILILNKRYGECEPGYEKSNTEREIETILQHHEENKKKRILAYFRKSGARNPDQGPQERKVEELKMRLQKLGILHKEYSDEYEFKEMFTHDMYNLVMRMKWSPYKKDFLRKFWVFGDTGVRSGMKIAIIYPPVPRKDMGQPEDNIWLTRLQPNIFFEDYKALYKIKKTIELSGTSEYRIFPNHNLPSYLNNINRVWLCIPRNRRAKQILAIKYKDRSRFIFLNSEENPCHTMKWKAGNGSWITITSPVSLYLREQRLLADSMGDWKSQLGNIIVKDYGVIARFCDRDSEKRIDDGTLKDFFISGVRGLGTWGAAYFLDRYYKLLEKIPDDGDFQMLIEATYSNNQITEVIDVSEKNAHYFNEQKSPKVIKRIISEHIAF